FKELWAISERNVAVKHALANYYQDLHEMLCNVLEKVAAKGCRRQQIDKAAGILLPFIRHRGLLYYSFKPESFS
ncbi:MAG: hypothetical protein ACI9UN_005355, partial [Granulosicoccus sp.]